MRLHRRLRRLQRCVASVGAQGSNPDLRARLSVRLARRAVACAAGCRRADLRQSRTRLRFMQHALADTEPLLCAVRTRRKNRAMVRRALLERNEKMVTE